MSTLPKIISMDDHALEPSNLWQDRLPAALKERGPRIERTFGYLHWDVGKIDFIEGEGPGARAFDLWIYDDLRVPLTAGFAQALLQPGLEHLDAVAPIRFEDMLPSCYLQGTRLLDMDANHCEPSLLPDIPEVPRADLRRARGQRLRPAAYPGLGDHIIIPRSVDHVAHRKEVGGDPHRRQDNPRPPGQGQGCAQLRSGEGVGRPGPPDWCYNQVPGICRGGEE